MNGDVDARVNLVMSEESTGSCTVLWGWKMEVL
jgi:hypothetical protein